MSALREANLSGTPQLSPAQIAALNMVFWEWYHNHADTVLFKRKVLLFSVTIRVRDLRPLFVMLFGEEVVR